MSYGEPARTPNRGTRTSLFAPLCLVSAALIGVIGYRSFVTPSSPQPAASLVAEPRSQAPPERLHRDRDAAVAETGRVASAGVKVFDDHPAVANLDPVLLGALRRAATDAAGEGVRFSVTSGWRSAGYQEQLLREAIATYGSAGEAARWVATPTTSAHVSGDAVDIGPSEAADWLSRQGAAYGLCQIYGNEPWHYELRPRAADHGCPPTYADPTQDPRMRR